MATQTTPSRANRLPSYHAFDPARNDPPVIQIITGNRLAPGSGVQMFRLRQSSPTGERSHVAGAFSVPGNGGCGGFGPSTRASRTPVHGSRGCGARRWFAPKGGAAYGTPLNVCTPSTKAPRTFPCRVLTSGVVAYAIVIGSSISGANP